MPIGRLAQNNNGRRYIVLDNRIIWVRPTLFGKRVDKDRWGYDTPRSLELSIDNITEIAWSEGWFLIGPSLVITCTPGSNDPWRTSKGEKPWKLKFGSGADDRARNRALVMAWILHLAVRERGGHVLKGPLPSCPELMPTRKEVAMLMAIEAGAKVGGWLKELFGRFVEWLEAGRGRSAADTRD